MLLGPFDALVLPGVSGTGASAATVAVDSEQTIFIEKIKLMLLC
jgi:hypothetical protein